MNNMCSELFEFGVKGKQPRLTWVPSEMSTAAKSLLMIDHDKKLLNSARVDWSYIAW